MNNRKTKGTNPIGLFLSFSLLSLFSQPYFSVFDPSIPHGNKICSQLVLKASNHFFFFGK